MPSTTMKRARGEHRGEGYGLVLFAAMLLGITGVFNVIDGIAAIARSSVFVANARFVFSDLRTWGWVALILGAVQVLASLGVLAGNQVARWFGVAAIGLNTIAQMFLIASYPFWALMIIAVDLAALWGLCAYGGRKSLGK